MWVTNNEKNRILNLHQIDVLTETTVKQINVPKDKIYDTLSPVLKQNETYSGTLDGKSLHIEAGNDVYVINDFFKTDYGQTPINVTAAGPASAWKLTIKGTERNISGTYTFSRSGSSSSSSSRSSSSSSSSSSSYRKY